MKLNSFVELGAVKEHLLMSDILDSRGNLDTPNVEGNDSDGVHVLSELPARSRSLHYYDDFSGAVASAIKIYPILQANYKNVHCRINFKNSYFEYYATKNLFSFAYKNYDFNRSFKVFDRISAFRAILYCYTSLRNIKAIHLMIRESIAASNFGLFANELPVMAISYKTFTGRPKLLIVEKNRIVDKQEDPKTEIESKCREIGLLLSNLIHSAPLLEDIPIVATIDYSKFEHSERIQISPKAVKTLEHESDNIALKQTVYPCRSKVISNDNADKVSAGVLGRMAGTRYDHDD